MPTFLESGATLSKVWINLTLPVNRPLKMAIRLKAKKEEKREREREGEGGRIKNAEKRILVFGYKCFSSISEHATCVHCALQRRRLHFFLF